MVALCDWNVFSKALTIFAAASCQPKYSSIITPDSRSEDGLTLFLSAIVADAACVASNRACH